MELAIARGVVLFAGGPCVQRGDRDTSDAGGESGARERGAGALRGVGPTSADFGGSEGVEEFLGYLVETRTEFRAQIERSAGGKRFAVGPAGEEFGLDLARGLDLGAEKQFGVGAGKTAIGGLLSE